mmetsp:Transcript_11235/g.23768  ORF Transcript_11235/g.23768 Transcript_11235/m.23768 type:complete len:450 (-) Transcript_11235:514-1863(-)
MRASISFLDSMSCRFLASLSAFDSASRTICSMSSSERPPEDLMTMFCSFPVPLSLAETLRIPSASMSKETSIWGTPRGAGGMPTRSNSPRLLLSAAISRSPCMTLIWTCGWLSAAVLKVCCFLVGMVVFRGMSLVMTPPSVSIPRERGVTSSNKISLTSPFRTPPWMAAPMATTSSGLTPRDGFLPKNSSTVSCTFGIRVMPPTRMISWMSDLSTSASFMQALQGPIERSTRGCTMFSNCALEILAFMCLGPEASAVIKGRETSVCARPSNSLLAFSAASLSRCMARLSPARSIPASFLNSLSKCESNSSSKSSPPSMVSPLVALTSKTPPCISRTLTSKVPPPRSKTAMVFPSALSIPYASEAAVGSLMILRTSSPAIFPASLVACLWLSLKYAGTVTTALLTVRPRNPSAVSFIFPRTMDPIWLGEYLVPLVSATHASSLWSLLTIS